LNPPTPEPAEGISACDVTNGSGRPRSLDLLAPRAVLHSGLSDPRLAGSPGWLARCCGFTVPLQLLGGPGWLGRGPGWLGRGPSWLAMLVVIIGFHGRSCGPGWLGPGPGWLGPAPAPVGPLDFHGVCRRGVSHSQRGADCERGWRRGGNMHSLVPTSPATPDKSIIMASDTL